MGRIILEAPDKCGFKHDDNDIAAMHDRIIELQTTLQEIYARMPVATLEKLEGMARLVLHTKPPNIGSDYSQEG